MGKSTLFNKLVGERLSIISPKPQTTRNNILGIVTDENAQMLFLDTPGLLEEKYRLHAFMTKQIREALESADILLGIVDASNPDDTFDDEVQEAFARWNIPRVIVLNKVDLCSDERIKKLEHRVQEALDPQLILAVSATTGKNLPNLHKALVDTLPLGPQFYPEDMLAEQPERFFVAEFIREEVFNQLHQELPYAIAVVVEAFHEDRPKVYIQANIIVERNSQKGIVIGKGGRSLKAIGQHARKKVEAFLNRPVFLDLHVKVYENWRKKDGALRGFGYDI
ncbi:MAG: GTPase Era [Candidatus Latescibacteria bacterium]|nr:GTPase Era [Candidatus Latescibacterota bacterium]MBT4141339.1 GTPase Era [Candidatus Latescibacterota bacterium]